MRKTNIGEMKNMKNRKDVSSLWDELKAGETIEVDNITYKVHVSKKGDEIPSLFLSTGVTDIDGKIRFRGNNKLPLSVDAWAKIDAQVKKILPYAIKTCVKIEAKAQKQEKKSSPNTSTPVSDEPPAWAKAMMEGIGQLGKNQSKINSRLSALEGKK
jgi:hypothetical protein